MKYFRENTLCLLLAIILILFSILSISAKPISNDYSEYYNAKPGSNASKHIFFTGIPMPGHIFPLLATAEQLALNGYTVTVATLSNLEKTVLNHKHDLYVIN